MVWFTIQIRFEIGSCDVLHVIYESLIMLVNEFNTMAHSFGKCLSQKYYTS
jgi:hypothetical protein